MLLAHLILAIAVAPPFECHIQRHHQPAPCATQDYFFMSRGLRLACTLYKSSSASPVVVIVAGSNPAGRDDRYLQTVAKVFASDGVSALIYDKPGVGKSQGTYL